MSSSSGSRPEAKDYWPHFQDAGALNAWVIDLDGDVERARSQDWFKRHKITLFDHPAYSPDLNPIENV
ncbi:uncharacterized protein yc1106_01901 [Curvularia clavata]|uniref:Tc1-like transposase DDE domain-containing protein n=1 Tax=Curvularia clavata TaxID=95742 RepID=A0A9Q8Z2N4_CURCL|nr:uncharacterized protein yc1106_01901 [Curvularia clavata]